jgi:chromosome segregation ATPase
MTNAIEQTKRQMYTDLKRFEHMVGSTHLFKTFQDSLEAHLEEQRKELCRAFGALGRMTQERDDIQGRLHAVDHKCFAQDQALKLAGEELRECQTNLRHWRDEGGKLHARIRAFESGEIHQQYLRDRQDLMDAEKLSDSLDEKLRDAQSVIAHQEQLIVGQRLAIAELYMAGRHSNSAVATLQRLGYTDHGGQLWKPPLGRKPDFELCTNDAHIQDCKCGRG